MTISVGSHQFPPAIIRHDVWLHVRFTLSYRRRPRPTSHWRLDEVAVMPAGRQFWLWRGFESGARRKRVTHSHGGLTLVSVAGSELRHAEQCNDQATRIWRRCGGRL